MILFITGPSGAGKSTLARAWVESKNREIALIDADQITSWLRNGEKSAVEVAVEEGPVERIAEQYRITGKVYAAAIEAYAANGVDVVIAQLCGYDPPPPWSKRMGKDRSFGTGLCGAVPEAECVPGAPDCSWQFVGHGLL
ncbi:MAG: hypothetical protein R2911_25845 [Caldilineaceae bacterium]